MSSDCHHCSKIQDGLTLSYQFIHAVLETDVKTTVVVVVVSLLNSEVNCF